MGVLMPIMMFIMNIATVLVVWVGAQQLDLGNIAIGDMMALFNIQCILLCHSYLLP